MATTPRLPVVVLLVLAAAALAAPAMADYAHPPLDPNQNWYKPYDLITFNVATDDYEQLMTNIFNIVKQDSNNKIWGPGSTVWVMHHQAVNMKPFKWLILELVGAGDNRIMLAIRGDNLYVTGFTDRSGLWYIFSNRPRSLIPVATVFRLADDYPDLIGGAFNLEKVRVSKQTILDAVERVSSFVPRDNADVGYVGRALAIMAVTFSEASRFHPFHDAVLHGWESQSGADVGVLWKLVVKWRVASCALMISVQEGGTWSSSEVWDLRRNTQIRTLDDALHTVKLALWPWREKCSYTITWLKQ